MRKVILVLCALGFCAGVASASSYVTPTVYETVTFTGVESFNGLGDPNNTTLPATLTGGYMLGSVSVSGTLTEVLTGTYASEADIAITTPGGSVTANGATTTLYDGTIAVGPTVTSIASPFDPAGVASFEFFESYNDGAGADQVWDDVTISFQGPAVANGYYSMGALPNDGTVVSATGTNVIGGFDFYDFSIGEGVAAGDYLNIQSRDALTGDTIDSELAIFDSNGFLIGLDDDGQETAFGGLYSMLSFGAADPLTPAAPTGSDALPGEDGLTLPAGDYTVVLGGYDSNFEDLTIGVSHISEIVPGTSDGDYEIRFSYTPEPTSLLGLILLGLLRRR